MEKVEELAALLRRLNAGEDPVSVRKEAQEFLASIDPKELSLAEQQLMEAGIAPEDLRHLCVAHVQMLEGELEQTKASLGPGHVIHTMMSEHDLILGFLAELDGVNQSIQRMNAYNGDEDEYKRLTHIAEHLIGAEPHYQREEQVLFPQLESRGVSGPPRIMRLEHEDLRNSKHELEELTEAADKMDFGVFKSRLDTVAKSLVFTLRDHIFKENNILYPTALDVIQEQETWREMRAACDKIGYCCFTPESDEVQTLDLRPLPPFQRHERIFQVWDGLGVGQAMRIINDHDPKPLHYQFEAEYTGQYGWEYEQQGPVDWIVRITRTRAGAAQPAQA